MDIRQLSYFLTIAKAQNYSHASKSLFVSQPALKQAISKMEDELNAPLFVYQNHRLNLTETGKMLQERGEPILKDFNQLVFDLQEHVENRKQNLTIGVTFLTMLQYMDQISRFIRQNPSINLQIVQDGSMKLQHLLVKEKIDIGILSLPQVEPDIIIDFLDITESSYSGCVVVPKGHPLACKKNVVFTDLAPYNIASLSDNFALGVYTKERSQELKTSDHIILVHDDFEILLRSLDRLDAITILPKELEEYSSMEELVWIPLMDSRNLYKQGLAYRKKLDKNSDAIQKFIQAIKL
ncbi:LysR family transcriptional regulator [Streptococcus hongkongensis]|nr:LysR family transcriptional regulator [Streptococcus uberis]